MLVPKEIIRPGVYFYTDAETNLPRKLVVTAEGVRHFYDTGQQMLAAGLSIPIPLEHQDAKPLTAKEKAAKQLLNNSGWVSRYELRKVKDESGSDVDALFGVLDLQEVVTDPDGKQHRLADKLAHTIKWTSPWISSFTDGDGRAWNGVISHLALTTRPRITRQQPFGSIAAAMSYALNLNDAPLDQAATAKRGLPLSRALLVRTDGAACRPLYPVAFSLAAGIAMAAEEVLEEKKKAPAKKPAEKPADAPPPKDGEPLVAPKVPAEPGMDPLAQIEESIVDADGDISVWEVITDLLASEGYDFPEGTTGDNFAERCYKLLMDKLKSKGEEPLAAPLTMPDNQPPTPPKNQTPPNPVIQEQAPLYMSLEQATAITDPQQRQVALSLVASQTKLKALEQQAFEGARARRQQRLDRLCRSMPKEARDALVAHVAKVSTSGAQFSLADDGKVSDPLDDVLKIFETGFKDIPPLLTTPQAQLSELAHPREYSGEMSEERRQAVAAEQRKNAGLPAA